MNIVRTNVLRSELIVILVLSLVLHRTFVVSTNTAPPSKCCNSSLNDGSRVEVKFKTTVVQNEYILKFVDYYTPQTREKFIRAALNDSEVSAVAELVYVGKCTEHFDGIFRLKIGAFYHGRIRPPSILVTLM